MTSAKKFSVRLNPETAKMLEKLASEQNISMTAALQRAIATEDFVRSQIASKNKILIEKPNRTFTEVVFR